MRVRRWTSELASVCIQHTPIERQLLVCFQGILSREEYKFVVNVCDYSDTCPSFVPRQSRIPTFWFTVTQIKEPYCRPAALSSFVAASLIWPHEHPWPIATAVLVRSFGKTYQPAFLEVYFSLRSTKHYMVDEKHSWDLWPYPFFHCSSKFSLRTCARRSAPGIALVPLRLIEAHSRKINNPEPISTFGTLVCNTSKHKGKMQWYIGENAHSQVNASWYVFVLVSCHRL